jgi:tetratricopeptide (TPR) repeat protein
MKKMLLWGALLAVPGLLLAQKPKSQKEVDAVNAVANAKTPDERIAAVENLIQKFSDTEFKSMALYSAAQAAAQKRDNAKAVFYAEESLKADKNNIEAMLLLATAIAQQTREFDLDKDEKLAKSEKYAKDALTAIPTVPKPNPQITDAQWDGAKKDMSAEAHVALGMDALVKKKNDVAISEFKTAAEVGATQDATIYVRLASVYNDSGKPEDALAAANKALSMPDLSPAVKQFAESEKSKAEKAAKK